MERGFTPEDKHSSYGAGDRGDSRMGKGLSPALMGLPSGPKAPLSSDLELILDNSLLLPPFSTPSDSGLLAQG